MSDQKRSQTEQPHDNQKSKDWTINPEKAIKNMKWIVIIFIIAAGSVAYVVQNIVKESNDLGNATALSAEIVFGIFISLIVYVYSKRMHEESKKQQNETSELIAEIKEIESRQQKIIHEQAEFRKRRHDYAINRLKSDLPQLKEICNQLDVDVTKYSAMSKRTQEAEAYALIIESEDLQRNYYCDKIDRIVNQSVGILDPSIIDEVQEILKLAGRNAREVTPQGIRYNLVLYKIIISSIDGLLSKLPNIAI